MLYLGRPIVVMLSNIKSGCPQFGIDKAFIIYEAPVETRITRLMGLFEDWESIEKIGYIRSNRDYFVYSLMEHYFIKQLIEKRHIMLLLQERIYCLMLINSAIT